MRWYDRRARDLPWRAVKGGKPDPYHVAVSEFMLQQTTVATVIPYFKAFIKRWPGFARLAKAELEEVRAQWAGLGYYRRAGFLHRLAQTVMKECGGNIPQEEAALRALPGLGPYSAAAIAAIAFDKPACVVDGNVERVMARLFALAGTGPLLRKKVYEQAAPLVPKKRAGDYAQAVMELGATVCTPRNPSCDACPWRKQCKAHALGKEEVFPHKVKAKKTPHKFTAVFVVRDGKGRVLLRRRPETGLLAGLWEFPSTPWALEKPDGKAIRLHAPHRLAWKKAPRPVIHVFSHFRLEMALQLGHSPTTFSPHDADYRWMKWAELRTLALPAVMRKVADAAKAAFDEDVP